MTETLSCCCFYGRVSDVCGNGSQTIRLQRQPYEPDLLRCSCERVLCVWRRAIADGVCCYVRSDCFLLPLLLRDGVPRSWMACHGLPRYTNTNAAAVVFLSMHLRSQRHSIASNTHTHSLARDGLKNQKRCAQVRPQLTIFIYLFRKMNIK